MSRVHVEKTKAFNGQSRYTVHDCSALTRPAGGVLSEKTCRFHDVLDHLNLTTSRELYYMTRPVNNHTQPTLVTIELSLYAILDVVEKDQKFIPYVWTVMKWQNDFISWNKDDFCGIDKVSIPTEVLWKPDITIEEMVEKDKAPPSPHLFIRSNGEVEVQNDQVLVSTCRMKVHRFPFDTQSCSLSFKSVIHTVKDILLVASENSKEATEQSKEVMRTQYEWLFINIKILNTTTDEDQDMVVYTVNMKRRSLLYIVNFLLPVMFFLCLDLASFLVSHGGGEKLTFKVTVLLAVTVLQLILNEILPSSSDQIPLIAMYCIGIFAMMLVSLLETILVMYLMKKDDHPVEHKVEEEETMGCVTEDTRDHGMFGHIFHRGLGHSGHNYDAEMSSGGTEENFHQNSSQLNVRREHGLRTEVKVSTTPAFQDTRGKVSEESVALEKILDELKRVEHSLLHLSRRHEEPGEWTRLAKRVNKVFFVVYVGVVTTFLVYVFIEWQRED
ncbi:5-hydroxytryptamine receptor 3A-like [Eucyclogobius newberryi]|uniref:5-hydroxytryptamine receptor 3A-like n=1 Tax=Eucyclogobius newberryi TaxID=166745 RepID=UPI003B5A730E